MKEFVTVSCRKTCGICKVVPIDCKHSSWGEWSKCSKSCGKGVQERTRTIVTPAKNGGKACSVPNKEGKACNTEACPECKDESRYCKLESCWYSKRICRKTCGICPTDCKYSSWGEWSKCSQSCGGGLQERTRTVTLPKMAERLVLRTL